MKIPKHIAQDLFDDEYPLFPEGKYIPECPYDEYDGLLCEEGVCLTCDWKRLQQAEEYLDWGESTEYWDFHDNWRHKYEIERNT